MKLCFVRHGESEANVLRVISNRGFQHPLTDKGREQGQTLARRLMDVGIHTIYTSPLMRAVQTADILASAWHVDITVHDALREYDCGVAEGRSDEAAWAQHALTLQRWLVDGDYAFRIEGGESFRDIQARFVPFIEALVKQYGQEDVSLALVGHGGTYRCMLPLVLDNIDSQFVRENHIGNTEFVLVAYMQERLVCVEWCGKAPPSH